MSAISFEAELDDALARARLQELLDRMDDRKPFFAAVGQILADSTRERFRTETDPQGRAWTPLRPSTVRRRQRRGRSKISILRDRGLLAGSIRFELTDDSVAVGSVLQDYAAIHQLGGEIDMPARKQVLHFKKTKKKGNGRRFAKAGKNTTSQTVDRKAHKITIPARPYLGISAGDQADILDVAERWLTL